MEKDVKKDKKEKKREKEKTQHTNLRRSDQGTRECGGGGTRNVRVVVVEREEKEQIQSKKTFIAAFRVCENRKPTEQSADRFTGCGRRLRKSLRVCLDDGVDKMAVLDDV